MPENKATLENFNAIMQTMMGGHYGGQSFTLDDMIKRAIIDEEKAELSRREEEWRTAKLKESELFTENEYNKLFLKENEE